MNGQDGRHICISGDHIGGLVQEKCNSSALAMGYVFLALTHQYGISLIRDSLHQPKKLYQLAIL